MFSSFTLRGLSLGLETVVRAAQNHRKSNGKNIYIKKAKMNMLKDTETVMKCLSNVF